MSHSCNIMLLSLLLSLLLWPTVSSLQCYRCQSIKTPSCKYADETNGWKTCRDDMCLTAIGFARIPFIGPLTAVFRDCNATIESLLTAAGQVPVKIPDRCVHGNFDYHYQQLGVTISVNATICPCFSSLCNAGDITLGGTAGTGSPPPPPTTMTTTSTTATSSLSRLSHVIIGAIVPSFPAHRDASASNGYDSATRRWSSRQSLAATTARSDSTTSNSISTPTSYTSHPTLIVAVFSAVIILDCYAL